MSLRYLLASFLIALTILASNWFVKQKIQEQMLDSRFLNLAGQQARLGQQLVKSALLLSGFDSLRRESYRNELLHSINQLAQGHDELTAPPVDHVRSIQNTDTIRAIFQQIQPAYYSLVTHCRALLDLTKSPNVISPDLYQSHVHVLLRHEEAFSSGIEAIIDQYEQESKQRTVQLILMQEFLTYLSLSIIVLVILFVFRPVARFIKKFLSILSQSRAQAKTLAQERQLLFASLEKSHKYLSNIHFAVEQATLFAKVDCHGKLLYISPQFRQHLKLPDEYQPADIPSLLQIPSDDLVASLSEVQKQGFYCTDWQCINRAGYLIWLTVTVVPVRNDQGELYQYLFLCIDITEKKKAIEQLDKASRAKIKRKIREQRMRSALVLQAQEEERKRIAMELHDNIGQSLTALKYNVEAIEPLASNEVMRQQLISIGQLLRESIAKVRQTSFHLMPSVLSDYGLAPVLKDFAQEMARITGKTIRFVNHTQFDQRLEEHIEMNIYRIVQESLTNALKYAQATEISISLRHNYTSLWVSIADDGIGFETPSSIYSKVSVSGRGIGNMEERAKYLQGQFTIKSSSGKGTKIIVQVPLSYQKEMMYDNYRIGG